MKDLKLTLEECLVLYSELNGLTDQSSMTPVFKGLLNQRLPITIKYKLNKLSNILKEEKELFDKLRTDLIKKHADDPKAENVKISATLVVKGKEVPNPNLEEFQKELKELLSQEKEIQVYQFIIDDFNFESEDYYPIFFDKVL